MERGVLLERLARATLTVVMVGGLAGGAGAAGAPGGTSPAATPEAGRGLPAPARGAGAPRAGSEPLLQRLLNSPEGRRLLRGGMDAASLARLEHGYKGAGSPLPLVDDTTLAALRARAARRAPASAHPSAADATNPVQPIQPTLSLAPGAPLPALDGLHPRLAVAPGPIVAGARIPVTLSGFAPRETVVLRLDGHALTRVVANGTGALGVALAIPGATAGGAHTLRAEGQLVRVPARTVLRVLGVRATPGRLAAGTRTGVSGGGFRPGALVTLTLRPVNGQTVTLGLDGADGGGRLRPMRVAIPDDVAAGAATIVARAGDGEEVTTGLYVDAGRPASLAAIPLPSRPAPARTRGLAHHPLPLKGRGAAGARGQGHAFRVSRPHAGRLPTLPAGRPLAGRLPAHAPGRAVGGEGGRAVTSQARARAAYLGLPISFEVNRG